MHFGMTNRGISILFRSGPMILLMTCFGIGKGAILAAVSPARRGTPNSSASTVNRSASVTPDAPCILSIHSSLYCRKAQPWTTSAVAFKKYDED